MTTPNIERRSRWGLDRQALRTGQAIALRNRSNPYQSSRITAASDQTLPSAPREPFSRLVPRLPHPGSQSNPPASPEDAQQDGSGITQPLQRVAVCPLPTDIREIPYDGGKLYYSPSLKPSEDILAEWRDCYMEMFHKHLRSLGGQNIKFYLVCLLAGQSRPSSSWVSSLIIGCGNKDQKALVEESLGTPKWKKHVHDSRLCLQVIVDSKFGYRADNGELIDGEEAYFPLISSLQPIRVCISAPISLESLCGASISRVHEGDSVDDHSDADTTPKLSGISCEAKPIGTMSGVVIANGRLYGLTVGHPFVLPGLTSEEAIGNDCLYCPSTEECTCMPPMNSHSEESNALGSALQMDETTDEGRYDQKQEGPSVQSLHLTPYGAVSSLALGQYRAFCAEYHHGSSRLAVKPLRDSDWALIELDPALIVPNSFKPLQTSGKIPVEGIELEEELCTGPVWVVGGRSEAQRGLLNETCASMMLDEVDFIVRQVDLKQPLLQGDSGAWVVRNGKVCGMMIAGSDLFSWGYMLPIEHVFEDISKTLGLKDIRVPPASEIQQVRQSLLLEQSSVSSQLDVMPISSNQHGLDNTNHSPDVMGRAIETSNESSGIQKDASVCQDLIRTEASLSDFKVKLDECTVQGVCGRDYILVRKLTEWLRSQEGDTIEGNNQVARLLYQTYRNSGQPEFPISAEQICAAKNCAILVFSILLDIGYGHLIKDFHRHQIVDSQLPSPLEKLRTAFKSLRSPGVVELAAGKFYSRQWAFSPATFDLHLGQEWTENRVIPICNKEEINVGGTAKVYRIEVQEEFVSERLKGVVSASRYNNPNDSLGYRYEFALKVFQEGKRELYENELKAFLALKDHDGMVRYLTDYGHTETRHTEEEDKGEESRKVTTYNILLEFGELDLEQFFGYRLSPVLQTESEKFWKDLFEVADAVKGIHGFEKFRGGERQEYYGWHADIKPDNILSVRGNFKLADPGFARFVKKTDKDNIIIGGGTTTYGAPECYPRKGTQVPVPRTIDIWSLGCVFSIAATWVVLGYQGIRQYNWIRKRAIKKIIQERASQPTSGEHTVELGEGDYFHDGREVLQDVRHWHNHLRNAVRRTDAITSQVLDIVDGSMLRGNSKDRIEAKALCAKLNEIPNGGRTGPTVPLSETIIEALLEVDEEAPSEPTGLKPLSRGMSLATPEDRTPQDRTPQDRVARKSKLFSTSLMKTAHRSEILKSALGAHSIMPRAPETIYGSPTEEAPPLPVRPSLWDVETGGRVLDQDIPNSYISHNYSQSNERFTPPATLKRPITSLSISNISTNAPNNRTPDQHKAQNVSQARADTERRQKSSLPRRAPVDDYLGRFFGDRDIKFLVDNAGTMEDFWDEATYLLETLAMKAKGQDRDGMDLSFTVGNKKLDNATRPSKFKEAMEDTKAKPMPGVDTDMRKPLGDIFLEYLSKVWEKRSFVLRQKVRKLTLIILTDGKWEGMGARRDDVDEMIIKFLKDLERAMGTLQFRPVSIQFVQFGNDPDATFRLRRLDDELIHSGIPDIVDTEPSYGDVNKMLLGSFVAGIDGRDAQLTTSPPASPHYGEASPRTPPPSMQPFFGSPEQRISPPQAAPLFQIPAVGQPQRSSTNIQPQPPTEPRRSNSLIPSRHRNNHPGREGRYSKT